MNVLVSRTLHLRWRRFWNASAACLPGLLAAALIAVLAHALSALVGGPAMVYALLAGFAAQARLRNPVYQKGVAVAAATILRLGVGMLGAGITLAQIGGLGPGPVSLAAGGIAITLAAGLGTARILGLSRELGLLLGGAVAICGASAALAIASVLPRKADNEAETLVAVMGVTALSTVAMILYPLMTALAGMDEVTAGVFLGATIHDVAQVVGAGYMISDTAGETATVVKLLRVACLVPVVAMISLLFARKAGEEESAGAATTGRLAIPWFLLLFVALSLLASYGVLPESFCKALSELARFLLVMAIAALGMKASLSGLVSVGPRPVAVLIVATLVLAAAAFAALAAFPAQFG